MIFLHKIYSLFSFFFLLTCICLYGLQLYARKNNNIRGGFLEFHGFDLIALVFVAVREGVVPMTVSRCFGDKLECGRLGEDCIRWHKYAGCY